MNKKQEIKPYLFTDGTLIIALSKDWLNVFDSVPAFTVEVSNDLRLVLTSQLISKRKNHD